MKWHIPISLLKYLDISMILLVGILLGVDLYFKAAMEYSCLLLKMRSLKGAEMLMEDRSSENESLVGLTIPRPPNHTGYTRIL